MSECIYLLDHGRPVHQPDDHVPDADADHRTAFLEHCAQKHTFAKAGVGIGFVSMQCSKLL
jgi:hypothetical protein